MYPGRWCIPWWVSLVGIPGCIYTILSPVFYTFLARNTRLHGLCVEVRDGNNGEKQVRLGVLTRNNGENSVNRRLRAHDSHIPDIPEINRIFLPKQRKRGLSASLRIMLKEAARTPLDLKNVLKHHYSHCVMPVKSCHLPRLRAWVSHKLGIVENVRNWPP